eukprot:gene4541-5138_t
METKADEPLVSNKPLSLFNGTKKNKITPVDDINKNESAHTATFEIREPDGNGNELDEKTRKRDSLIRKRIVKISLIATVALVIILLSIVLPLVLVPEKQVSNKPKPTKVSTTNTTTSSTVMTNSTVFMTTSTKKATTTTRQPPLQCSYLMYVVSNGVLNCIGQNIGNECSVSCDIGYSLVPSTGRHNCTNVNGSLTWSGAKGQCQPKSCSSQPNLSNSTSQSWVCTKGLQVGSICNLNCRQQGYQSLNPITTCLFGNKWSTGWTGCIVTDACAAGLHNCSSLADCIAGTPGMFSCTCQIGYAGDGWHCANDTDSDGVPDNRLSCASKSCQKDNCVSTPNSGQEDLDNDGTGDACDDDDDNDGITDKLDNCPLVYNPNQNDTDLDGIGDACDNCRNTNNTDQRDTNSNGIGDACEMDADGDGVNNTLDNCPLVYNPDQRDKDNDTVGDACDNCPMMVNRLQTDANDNLIGDACEIHVDSDADGITDNADNCLLIPNGDQTDNDKDGVGDVCDSDKDNDGVPNIIDNCPLVHNPNQTDVNKNKIGDACENDDDGDGVPNSKDDFPLNASKNQTDFRKYNQIIFDDKGIDQPPPKWFLFDQGREILQTVNGNPGALIGKSNFGHLIFTGTLSIRSPDNGTRPDDDYVGIIFGFQSNRKFYVCSWKRSKQSYSITGSTLPYPRAYGRQGISLKKFHSTTGPGESLRDALWETGNAMNQSTLLWHDQTPKWEFDVSYQWNLIHDPDSGRIRIRWYQGKNLISDSGDIVDRTWRGGRVGVYVFSQQNVYFSAMTTKLSQVKNYALEFNGNNSYIDFGKWRDILNGKSSFTIDLWTYIDGTSNVTCEVGDKIDFGSDHGSNYGIFTQDQTDELEWHLSNSTAACSGPHFDHTTNNGSGFFLFFNSDYHFRGATYGDRARLLTPWFPATSSCSVELFIHMWDGSVTGTAMGSFQIDVRTIEGAWNQISLCANKRVGYSTEVHRAERFGQ